MQKKLAQIANVINNSIPEISNIEAINNSIENAETVQEIGKLYELSIEKTNRKSNGQFFTPREISDYIVSYLNIKPTQKVIDPSCGCGSFLLAIVDFWQNSGIEINFENLFGVDIDEHALHLTKVSLLLKSYCIDKDNDILNRNLILGNSIVENKLLDTHGIDWKEKFSDVFEKGGFDVVIGNPPYKTIRKYKDFDPADSNFYEILNGSVNVASLMIARGLEILKEGGILAFVLPKSLLHVNSYSKLREYLLARTSVIHIFDLGLKFKDVRGEQIILILKKKKPSRKHVIEIKTLKNGGNRLSQATSFFIPQKNFLKSNSKFLIFDNKKCYEIIDKIYSQGISLSRLVENNIFRGLPLNNYVTDELVGNKQKRILRGKSISKFKIHKVGYINEKYLSDFAPARIKKIAKKKIVLQNIFSSETGIVAAFDSQKMLTLDTVTNIIIENEEFAKYILGILHSKLINFFLILAVFNRSKLTMHTDQSYIGKIPIVEASDSDKFKKIVAIVDEIVSVSAEVKKENLRKLDEIVYRIYDISESEKATIENELKTIISPKSWW